MSDVTVALTAAFVDSAEKIAQAARAKAPVLKGKAFHRSPGTLRESIVAAPPVVKDGRVSVAVGIVNPAAFYGRFQDLGFHSRAGRKVPGIHFLSGALREHATETATKVTESLQAVIQKTNAS